MCCQCSMHESARQSRQNTTVQIYSGLSNGSLIKTYQQFVKTCNKPVDNIVDNLWFLWITFSSPLYSVSIFIYLLRAWMV